MTWCLTSLRPGFQDLNPSLTKKFPPAGIWKSIRDNSVDRIKITNSEKVDRMVSSLPMLNMSAPANAKSPKTTGIKYFTHIRFLD